VGAAAVPVGGALGAAARSIAGLLPGLAALVAALVMDAARRAQKMPHMFQRESIAGRAFACRGAV
jgi:hypothetical protein